MLWIMHSISFCLLKCIEMTIDHFIKQGNICVNSNLSLFLVRQYSSLDAFQYEGNPSEVVLIPYSSIWKSFILFEYGRMIRMLLIPQQCLAAREFPLACLANANESKWKKYHIPHNVVVAFIIHARKISIKRPTYM